MLHQIGTGSLGPVFRGEDAETGERVAIAHLQLKIGPERSRFIAEDLRTLITQLPAHLALTRLIDAGLEGGHPFVVSSLAAGEPLDAALREYGPAVLHDALPRLERMAEALDLAAESGIYHGALHPGDVMVSARETKITGLGVGMVLERAGVRGESRPPYSAPESERGPAADRFAFAAIAFEWLYGRPITGPAEAPFVAPDLPGADAARLSDIFTTALAPLPTDRFATCAAFVTAIRELARASKKRKAAAVLPFESEDPAGVAVLAPPAAGDRTLVLSSPTSDLSIEGGASDSGSEGDQPIAPPTPSPAEADSVFWRGNLSASSASPEGSSAGYSLRALAAVLAAGIAVGVAGGYLLGNARRSASPVAESVDPAPTAAEPVTKDAADTPVRAAAPAPPPATEAPAARATAPAASDPPPAARAIRREPAAPPASKDVARLLVRTSPAGAMVSLDGTVRGKTPLALRDLELGTRTIVLTRPGYASAERRITLTADRPSRSVDVSLTPVAAARPTPARPAAVASSTGLVVESRPPGAVVTIDGVRAGTTPLTLHTLSPGSHSVRLELPGYRSWSTTVEVKAGERARVAASLVGGT